MPVTAREDEVSLPPAAEITPPSGDVAWSRIAIPIAGILAGVVALLVFAGDLRSRSFAFLGAYLLPGGIDYGIPIGIGVLDLAPWWVIGLVTYFDLWITLFWVWNLDHLTRFEWVENRVNKSRERAWRLWQRFPWLRVATAPGLAGFILVPIPWTGSFAGIAIGKLIGLKDLEVYLASILGTLGRVIILAYGSAGIFSLF